MATSTEKYTAAAATGVMAAAGTGLIVYALKLSKPIWKPAAFAFLIEFFTHYSEDPPVKGKLVGSGKEAKRSGEEKAGWWLPSKLGYWTPSVTRMVNTHVDMEGREGGMYQAGVSAIVSGVIWYVVARGFFGVGHKGAIWYGGIFAVIGGYSGYLMGDEGKDGPIRFPQGGRYQSAPKKSGGTN